MEQEYWRLECVNKIRDDLMNYVMDKYNITKYYKLQNVMCKIKLMISESIMIQFRKDQKYDPVFPDNFIDDFDNAFLTKFSNKLTKILKFEVEPPKNYSITGILRGLAMSETKAPKRNYAYDVSVLGSGVYKRVQTEVGTFKIHIECFKKMKEYYGGLDFARDLALCLIRYEGIFCSQNHQVGITYYDYILKKFPNLIELFASPFNHSCVNFHSAFPDIDCKFGSRGRNMGVATVRDNNVYTCCPPYDSEVMQYAMQSVHNSLKKYKNVMFIIVLPVWERSGFLQLQKEYKEMPKTKDITIAVAKLENMLKYYESDHSDHWNTVLAMKKDGYCYAHKIVNRFKHKFKEHVSGHLIPVSETNILVMSNCEPLVKELNVDDLLL